MLNNMRKELEKQRAQDPKFAQVPGWGNLSDSHFSAEAAHQKALAQMQHQEQTASFALQDLHALLPEVAKRWRSLPADVFQALTTDPPATVLKLVQLRSWFPTADVSLMVSRRPSLLLDVEFEVIPAALQVLQDLFDTDAIDHMVQEQPLFLVEDIPRAVSHLNSWTSSADGASRLQKNPQLLLSIVPNRKLSLW